MLELVLGHEQQRLRQHGLDQLRAHALRRGESANALRPAQAQIVRPRLGRTWYQPRKPFRRQTRASTVSAPTWWPALWCGRLCLGGGACSASASSTSAERAWMRTLAMMYGYVTCFPGRTFSILARALPRRRAGQKIDTHDRGERLAERADRERHPRAQLRVWVRLPARGEHHALDALEEPVGDRRVHGEHEPGLDAEPEPADALLRDDLARDPEERVVVRLLFLLAAPRGLDVRARGRRGPLLRAVERASDLLARRDDGDGDGEDLRERARDGAQDELRGGAQRQRGAARGTLRGEAPDVGRADEGVEEEVGVLCGARADGVGSGGAAGVGDDGRTDVRMEKVLSIVAMKPL